MYVFVYVNVCVLVNICVCTYLCVCVLQDTILGGIIYF